MNYYKVLEIENDASQEEIKKMYKKLVLRWHPDKNLNNKNMAEEKFKNITEANSVLSDFEKRQIYDTCGHEGLKKYEFNLNKHNFNNTTVTQNNYDASISSQQNFYTKYKTFDKELNNDFNYKTNTKNNNIHDVETSSQPSLITVIAIIGFALYKKFF
jgi:DnaJ-class molecular chaperone